jgi:hypothetical protein
MAGARADLFRFFVSLTSSRRKTLRLQKLCDLLKPAGVDAAGAIFVFPAFPEA